MAYATTDDVEPALGRSLTDAETDQADGWLEDAALIIDGEGYTYTGDTAPDAFLRVSVNMVVRAVKAAAAVTPGAQSQQEQAGPFGRTVTYTASASTGGVWLSATDRAMLRPYSSGGGMVSVAVGSELYTPPVES